MTERWFGITCTRSEVIIVGLEYANDSELPTVFLDEKIPVSQTGDTPDDYKTIFERLQNDLIENKITHVIIKGSSPSSKGASRDILEGAELRGVLIAAASVAKSEVHIANAAIVSRTFGERKTDAYVKDSEFWKGQVIGNLRATAKNAAFYILSHKKR
jgi:hypothetical protein